MRRQVLRDSPTECGRACIQHAEPLNRSVLFLVLITVAGSPRSAASVGAPFCAHIRQCIARTCFVDDYFIPTRQSSLQMVVVGRHVVP